MHKDGEWAVAERQCDRVDREHEGGGNNDGGGVLATAKGAKRVTKGKRQLQCEEGGVSKRRLNRYTGSGKKADSEASSQSGGGSKTAATAVTIDVGLTGARTGDTLQGCGVDTANVVLRIDSGEVTAPSILRHQVEAAVGREAVVASFAKAMGLSRATAEMRYADCPTSDVPNHCPLGQSCSHRVGSTGDIDCGCEPAARFTILNQGVWQTFAEEHGHGEELQAMVAERRPRMCRNICARPAATCRRDPQRPRIPIW